MYFNLPPLRVIFKAVFSFVLSFSVLVQLYADQPKSSSLFNVSFGERPPIDLQAIPDDAFEPGILKIKFKQEYSEHLEANPAMLLKSGLVSFNLPSVDQLNQLYSAKDVEQHFASPSFNRDFSERHKAWGFHLWYLLRFDETADIRAMVAHYESLPEIELAEPEYRKRLIVDPGNEWILGDAPAQMLMNPEWIPNDPQFADQWHYLNTGQQNGTPGADISLPDAWEIETGNSAVIVAIVDDGIQFTHPDLAANMWTGIGFNFVNNSPTINPGNHGTHVAGTVAAVNNNGVGVSGVAGGTSSGDGVRLMSAQVFSGSSSGGFHLAPVWAADNGAAISQNSWGYTSAGVYDQSVLNAIDYFNANGGGDAMDGGITIFAAGNSDATGAWYPGFYSGAFAIAATNNQDQKAWYSNYGPWIDISAPGGETNSVNARGVLSTLTGNSYGYYQGTSMACPHASGVAALIISLAYGELTAQDVADILKNTTDDHYAVNPNFIGQLGTGRLNAYQALLETQNYVSGVMNPAGFTAAPLGTSDIALSWDKNAEENNVIIAFSLDNTFGVPDSAAVYQPGSTLTGGGLILYNGSATEFIHSGLQASTIHYYRIWSYSDVLQYSSGRSTSAITDCDLFQLPIAQSFDANNSFPVCWTTEVASGSVNWTIGTGNGGSNPSTAKSPPYNAYFKAQTSGQSGFTARLVSPEFNAAQFESAELRFWYTNQLRTFIIWTYQDILRVRYRTSESDPWVTLQTFNTNVANWTEVVITLPNLTSTYYISFEAQSGRGHGVCIDDVVITGSGGLPQYTISATAGPNGNIAPAGDVLVFENYNQPFTITANPGHEINALLVDNVPVLEAAGEQAFQYTFFNVMQDHTISASFLAQSYTVEVTVVPEEAGVVDGGGSFFYNDPVTLTAEPVHGYEFVHWSENGQVLSNQNPWSFLATTSHEIEAHFELASWNVEVMIDPENAGFVEGAGTYLHNSSIELLAVAHDDFDFANWMKGGEFLSSDNPLTIMVNDHMELTASFQSTVSVPELHSGHTIIFPNPSTGLFNLNVDKISNYQVFDMFGKLLAADRLEPGLQTIDLSRYPKGIYSLKINNSQELLYQKLIIH